MDVDDYYLSEHIESIEWIDSLPRGLVRDKIDMRYSTVTITKMDDGYQVYIGPKDPDLGGDAIAITLDDQFQLQDYEIERLEPVPDE